jgi:hypothetical protein
MYVGNTFCMILFLINRTGYEQTTTKETNFKFHKISR